MTKQQLEMMMKGLIATAVELIGVLGWEEAQKEVQRLTDLIHDLESFWNSDGELSAIDWEMKMTAAIEKAKL